MQKTEIIKADLTFRSVSFSTLYGATDEKYESMVKELDSIVKNSEKKSDGEIVLYEHLLKVHEHDLLRLPTVFLRLNKDSVFTVYLKESEYQKLNTYKYIDLYKEDKKVEVELELNEVDKNIFYSDNVINVKKVDGKSRSN
jgi:hypothetical protein